MLFRNGADLYGGFLLFYWRKTRLNGRRCLENELFLAWFAANNDTNCGLLFLNNRFFLLNLTDFNQEWQNTSEELLNTYKELFIPCKE